MKIFSISLCLFILSYSPSFSQIIFKKFNGLENALAESKAQNKPLFFDTYTDWCYWCKRMDADVFSKEDVAAYYNENFICVKVDGEAEISADFVSNYEVNGFPCMLILSGDGEILNRSDGAITDIENFKNFGKMAYYFLYPETSPWKINESKYNEGNRDPKFLMDYALSMIDGKYEQNSIDAIVNEFWSIAEAGGVDENTRMEMIYSFHDAFNDKRLNEFLAAKTKVIENFGEEFYYMKCINVIIHNLEQAKINDDEKLYNQVLAFSKKEFKNQEVVPLDEVLDYVKSAWNER